MDITLSNSLLLIFFGVLISIGCMLIVRKNISAQLLRSHHDVTDPLLAVLGTLFTILLGFMLANSMQRFESARDNIQQEAGAAGDIYRLVGGLPEVFKIKTRKDCLTYLDLVVTEEWRLMQKNKFSDKASYTYEQLWKDCLSFEPKTQGEGDIHQTLLASMTKLGECRRTRAAELTYSLPPSLWFIVVFGGLSTIFFTYFFAIENIKLQILMTSVITIVVGLNIYMLIGYDAPFSGDIALTSTPFESTKAILTRGQSDEK